MQLTERIYTFVELGRYLSDPENKAELEAVARRAAGSNPWFTPKNSSAALEAIGAQFLSEPKLTSWLTAYQPEPAAVRSVGVVLAGNIPAVGFHDLLCILLSGHKLMAKPSSQDIVLIQYFLQKITEINPDFLPFIQLTERMNTVDAFIATGSDNTARYFHHYFASKPHIIRKNRSSVAILTGAETEPELAALGHDILDYFGLGCRNVSTLFVPENYSFEKLLDTLEPMAPEYRNHHKYINNYDYNKSIYLVNQVPHYDNGFLLLTENDSLVSPISVVYVQRYTSPQSLSAQLEAVGEKIQCVVSQEGRFPGSIPFGKTQRPELWEYADGVDTMAFLKSL